MMGLLAPLALLAASGLALSTPGPELISSAALQGAVDTVPVQYRISFPNARHHEAEVEITFPDLPDGPLEVRMSRTSPGRYALHEFAKNVYRVSATDEAGRALEISRPDPHAWSVSGHRGTVVFRYTLFGDRADGTYTGIDNTHAHLNMPATFAWAAGLEERPIEVEFEPSSAEHRIATQLAPTDDPHRYTAPHLQYFLDSPTEISDFDLRTWTVQSNGEDYTIRLAVHHLGSPEEVDLFEQMVREVVDEQIAALGEAPDFDYGTYTFIADYLPWVAGDGMEHRNSTVLTSTRPLSTGALANLGTVSHEFFHAWNVERLRPRSLEPFDFREANMSGELWFAEGFTSYYTPLFIRRAGRMRLDDYAASIGGTLNTVINSPGRSLFSPVEMSQQAPFVDAAVSVDPTNRANTFISYYTWGAAIGLGLDLTLRAEYGLTLDGYMRALWEGFGREGRPYARDDLRRTLADYTGDSAFADDFFRRFIEGREVPDYERLLAHGGFLLRRAHPGTGWIGDAGLRVAKGAIVINTPTKAGTPLYEAGLSMGDTIFTIAGTTPADDDELARLLASYRPGDLVEVEIGQRGERRTTTLTIAEDPRVEVRTYESAGLGVTDEIRAFRRGWMGESGG